MKTLASSMMTIVFTFGLAASAAAQGAAPGAPAAPAAKPAAPAAPAAKAVPAAPAAAKAPVPPPPPPVKPTAPAEVATMTKTAGNWRCTGMAMGPSGEMKMNATVRNKLSLDKWWMQTTFSETGGGKYKFESFTTFDLATKKWHRVMVDNMGGHETAVSDGFKDGKAQWDAASRTMMGNGLGRHFEDMTNPKEFKMWGEYSVDKGKTWMKAYEASCKR